MRQAGYLDPMSHYNEQLYLFTQKLELSIFYGVFVVCFCQHYFGVPESIEYTWAMGGRRVLHSLDLWSLSIL